MKTNSPLALNLDDSTMTYVLSYWQVTRLKLNSILIIYIPSVDNLRKLLSRFREKDFPETLEALEATMAEIFPEFNLSLSRN